MAHTSGNATWTGATLIDATALENLENRVDTNASALASGFAPSDHSMIAWTFDPVLCGTAGPTVLPGQLGWFRVKVPSTQTCTGVALGIQAAGSGLTAGQTLAGLYDSAGTLLRSSTDCSTLWNSIGAKACPFTSTISVSPGVYVVAILVNGTTNPVFSGNSLSGGRPMQYGVVTPSVRSLAAGGPFSALPGTLPAATLASLPIWCGLY